MQGVQIRPKQAPIKSPLNKPLGIWIFSSFNTIWLPKLETGAVSKLNFSEKLETSIRRAKISIEQFAIKRMTSGLKPIREIVLPKNRLNKTNEQMSPTITPIGRPLPPFNEVERTIGRIDKIHGERAKSKPSKKAAPKSIEFIFIALVSSWRFIG